MKIVENYIKSLKILIFGRSRIEEEEEDQSSKKKTKSETKIDNKTSNKEDSKIGIKETKEIKKEKTDKNKQLLKAVNFIVQNKKKAVCISGAVLFLFGSIIIASTVYDRCKQEKDLKVLTAIQEKRVKERAIKRAEENQKVKEELEKKNYYYDFLIPYYQDDLAGYVNNKFEVVVEPTFDFADDFYEDLAVVSIEGKYGFIDKRGKLVINPTYDYASSFYNGYAYVKIGNNFTFIDKLGNQISEPVFGKQHSIGKFSDGLANVSLGGRAGFIDASGKFVIEPNYEETLPFSYGYALVLRDGNYFYINRQGKEVGNINATKATSFSEGKTLIIEQDTVCIVDTNLNKKPLPIKKAYDVGRFTGGLGVVKLNNNTCVFIDANGNTKKDKVYQEVKEFSEGLAAVKVGNLWGYVDNNLNTIIPPKFLQAGKFNKGFAMVDNDGRISFIDKTGKVFWQP